MVTRLYKLVRQRMHHWLSEHPIVYGPADFVEIDELYLKPLKAPDVDGRRGAWPPVIGMIRRTTGAVALEVSASHKTADIRAPILRHFPYRTTVVFTDEAASFNFLARHVDYKKAWYAKRGSAKWLSPRREHRAHGQLVVVHTNTIEGYWAKLRGHLHASRGWKQDYLPLFFADCMFRSLNLPLTSVLSV